MIPLLLPALAALALAGAWHLRQRTYARFFTCSRTRDQNVPFPETSTPPESIALAADGFRWPAGEMACDTAFLELRVAATGTGTVTEPCIEMRSRNFFARQHLERGARGVRYLNLSALLAESPAEGQRIWLHGLGVAWAPQTARLFRFANPWPDRARCVVLAPHPDDAEIAAFGLYRNTDSTVVTVTAGDLGSFYRPHFAPGDARLTAETARIRAWDSITAPMLGGVGTDRAINLGYLDSTLAAAFADPAQPVVVDGLRRSPGEIRRLNPSRLVEPVDVPATWHALVADFVRIFEQTDPELIATPHPLLDDHPDHAFTTLAACEALAKLGKRKGRLLLYTNHTPWSNLHPVGGTDGIVSLPPHFGEALPFRSIKSLPLDDDDRRLKLLALEAHHDLRALPSPGAPHWTTVLRRFAAGVRGQITGLDEHATSYFRRAVRPNELFFVVPFAEAEALAAQFLAAWRAGKIAWHRCQ